ncbi:hypothetical protein EYF80_001564 [Liparis tanakae]|uniref:Secreted protein n=1 Tax=Liparis tanakae TaxID=230148 RepID=A0A4Z2JFF7_9TELE|nr:hypothetical protein EYF80_001564 [Liparis tanakae]
MQLNLRFILSCVSLCFCIGTHEAFQSGERTKVKERGCRDVIAGLIAELHSTEGRDPEDTGAKPHAQHMWGGEKSGKLSFRRRRPDEAKAAAAAAAEVVVVLVIFTTKHRRKKTNNSS